MDILGILTKQWFSCLFSKNSGFVINLGILGVILGTLYETRLHMPTRKHRFQDISCNVFVGVFVKQLFLGKQ